VKFETLITILTIDLGVLLVFTAVKGSFYI